MIFHARVKEIPLRRVVRVVEWKRDRIAVGRRRLAVRNLRQPTRKLRNAAFPSVKRLALRIGQQGGNRLSLCRVVPLDDRAPDDAVFSAHRSSSTSAETSNPRAPSGTSSSKAFTSSPTVTKSCGPISPPRGCCPNANGFAASSVNAAISGGASCRAALQPPHAKPRIPPNDDRIHIAARIARKHRELHARCVGGSIIHAKRATNACRFST